MSIASLPQLFPVAFRSFVGWGVSKPTCMMVPPGFEEELEPGRRPIQLKFGEKIGFPFNLGSSPSWTLKDIPKQTDQWTNASNPTSLSSKRRMKQQWPFQINPLLTNLPFQADDWHLPQSWWSVARTQPRRADPSCPPCICLPPGTRPGASALKLHLQTHTEGCATKKWQISNIFICAMVSRGFQPRRI